MEIVLWLSRALRLPLLRPYRFLLLLPVELLRGMLFFKRNDNIIIFIIMLFASFRAVDSEHILETLRIHQSLLVYFII